MRRMHTHREGHPYPLSAHGRRVGRKAEPPAGKDVRERLKLKPGQKLQAIPFKGRVELIPLDPIEASRGFLRGIDTTVPREDDRV